MATTALDLEGRAERLADMEGSNYVDDEEWLDYANEGLRELHDILIQSSEDYALSSDTIAIVSGTDTYALPTDFYKLRGVDHRLGSNDYTLRPFMFRERNRYEGFSFNSYRYMIQGTNLKLIPEPSGSGSLIVWYAPIVAALTGDGSEIPAYIPEGFHKYVVIHMVARALQKEESDSAQAFLQEKLLEKDRIESLAAPRDAGEPKRVVDVRDWIDLDDPFPWGA